MSTNNVTISKREYRYLKRSNKRELKNIIFKNHKIKEQEQRLKDEKLRLEYFTRYSNENYNSYNLLLDELNDYLNKYIQYSKYLENKLDNKVIEEQSEEQSEEQREEQREVKSPETFY